MFKVMYMLVCLFCQTQSLSNWEITFETSFQSSARGCFIRDASCSWEAEQARLPMSRNSRKGQWCAMAKFQATRTSLWTLNLIMIITDMKISVLNFQAALLSIVKQPSHFTKSWNQSGWGWKAPLGPPGPPRSETPRAACTRPCPDVFLKISKEEPPEPPWASCARAPEPAQHRNAAWCSEGPSCAPVCAQYLWPCKGHHWQKLISTFFFNPKAAAFWHGGKAITVHIAPCEPWLQSKVWSEHWWLYSGYAQLFCQWWPIRQMKNYCHSFVFFMGFS